MIPVMRIMHRFLPRFMLLNAVILFVATATLAQPQVSVQQVHASVSVEPNGNLIDLSIRIWNPLDTPIAVQTCGVHPPFTVCSYSTRFEQKKSGRWATVRTGEPIGDTGPKEAHVYPPKADSTELISISPESWAFDRTHRVRLVIIGKTARESGSKPIEIITEPFALPRPKG